MKALKIFVAAVIVAAVGYFIYWAVTGTDSDPVSDEIVIPDGCDLDWAEEYIDSVYRIIPDGEFKLLKTRRGEMQRNYQDVMSGEPKKCQETVELILRNRYQARFIQMANNEFNENVWPHYSDIRDMNKDLLAELSQGSSELKRIEEICKEFGQVAYYNSLVKKQSGQKPKDIHHQWDMANARDLIDDTPSASDPVDHTNQYESSRQQNVKRLLYDGHVNFLSKLIELAKHEITDNPTKDNYNQVCEIVSKEIERFSNSAAPTYGTRYSVVEEEAEGMNAILDSYETIVISDENQD